MQQQALSVLIAWMRLEGASDRFNRMLRQEFGLTALQLSILHILGERPALPLAALRKTLLVHAATLGQAVDALRARDFCAVTRSPTDRRARIVSLTAEGEALLARLPLAGPTRLRQLATDPARLEQVAAALNETLELFGLEPWTTG